MTNAPTTAHPAPDPCHRRRPLGCRGRLADRAPWRACGAARDAAGSLDRRAQDRGLRRARLFELVPLGRRGGERHRSSARRNAAAWLAGDADRRRSQAAGRRRAGRRPRRLRRGDYRGAGTRAARRHPPRGNFTAAARLGQRYCRHRSPHLACARGYDPRTYRRGCPRLLRRDRADRSPQFDRLRRRLVSIALRQGRAGGLWRRLHQLPADARSSTTPSSMRFSPARKSASAISRRRRLISTAACRSK